MTQLSQYNNIKSNQQTQNPFSKKEIKKEKKMIKNKKYSWSC